MFSLAKVLEIARNPTGDPVATTRILARWIVDTFDYLVDIDERAPEVYPGTVIITREMVGSYPPHEALLVAKAIILAAEKAKGA